MDVVDAAERYAGECDTAGGFYCVVNVGDDHKRHEGYGRA